MEGYPHQLTGGNLFSKGTKKIEVVGKIFLKGFDKKWGGKYLLISTGGGGSE